MSLDLETTDRLLKAVLVLSRTVSHTLGTELYEASGRRLSKSKVQILRLLTFRGPHTPAKVAEFLGRSRPAVTDLIDSLEKDGLVKRTPSKVDGRSFLMETTGEGRRAYRRHQRLQRHKLRCAAREFPGEAESWIQAVTHITRGLAQADRTLEHYCFQCSAHEDGTCVLAGGNAACPYLAQLKTDAKVKS